MSNNIKAIILAAGSGKRLRPHTRNKPKCMLHFGGKTLLDRQLGVYEQFGISNINITTGHCAESVQSNKTRLHKFFDPDHKISNMVYSLLTSADELFDGNSDIIISYGDIVFQPEALEKLVSSKEGLTLITDLGWRDYWALRTEDLKSDVETFRWDPKSKKVFELGRKPNNLEEIEGQYIGLLKISKKFAPQLLNLYKNLDISKENTRNMYMTDFLQYIIDSSFPVHAESITHGWLEFDSVDDLEIYNKMLQNNTLNKYYECK